MSDDQSQIILVQDEPRGPSQLMEIIITSAAKTQYNLPQVQELMSVDDLVIVTKVIRLISAKVLTNAPVSGNPLAPVTELQKMFLVLWSEGWMKGQQIPLLTLNDVADADSTAATTIPYRQKTTRFDNWKKVDWNKSLIQFAQGLAPVNPPYSVIFEIEYQRFNAKTGQIIPGPTSA